MLEKVWLSLLAALTVFDARWPAQATGNTVKTEAVARRGFVHIFMFLLSWGKSSFLSELHLCLTSSTLKAFVFFNLIYY